MLPIPSGGNSAIFPRRHLCGLELFCSTLWLICSFASSHWNAATPRLHCVSVFTLVLICAGCSFTPPALMLMVAWGGSCSREPDSASALHSRLCLSTRNGV